jgi:RNA-binding protein
MLTITPTERRELRARAHHLHPVVAIGQHGLTPSVLREIEVNLRAHELIKVRAFSDIRGEREAMLGQICAKLDAAAVQHIGKLLILWRPAPKEAPDTRKPRAASAPGKRTPTARGAPAASVREAKRSSAKRGSNTGKEAHKTMAKSAPQARRPRDPAARTPARPPATQGEGRRGPKGVPSAPVSRERRRRRSP